VDEGRPAAPHVCALHEVRELALVEARPRALEQRLQAGVAQARADAQPVDLLRRLDKAQAHIVRIEAHDLEALLQALALREPERADHADALGAAALQLLGDELDTAVLAPAHVDAHGDALCQRHMVVPLDVHRDGFARPEGHESLDGAGPSRDPLRRVAGPLIGDDHQVIDFALLHEARKRLTSARVFGVRKPRELLFGHGGIL
jgi:hypothetical protein